MTKLHTVHYACPQCGHRYAMNHERLPDVASTASGYGSRHYRITRLCYAGDAENGRRSAKRDRRR